MAVRLSSDLVPSTRSAKVGDAITFSTKVENSGSSEESLSFVMEGWIIEPASLRVAPKARTRVEFSWRAILPEGKPAHTWRGKAELRSADGKVVATVPVDVYVSSS